jgi:hypothetical protein
VLCAVRPLFCLFAWYSPILILILIISQYNSLLLVTDNGTLEILILSKGLTVSDRSRSGLVVGSLMLFEQKS